MRTAFVLPAAALAVIGYGLISPPPAQAIPSCAEQMQMLYARLAAAGDNAAAVGLQQGLAQCAAVDAAKAGQPTQQAQQPAQQPAAGPCGPNVAAGINGTCGQQSNLPGLCAITGQCAPGVLPGAPPPPPPPPQVIATPPGPQQMQGIPPGVVDVPAAPAPNTGPPLDPGQCVNLPYYQEFQFYCATVGPPPPGWQPGTRS